MGIVCYSERILNPFRGVMAVIALDDADAVTIDGVHWELYIHDCFDNLKNAPAEFAAVKLPDIKFGDWSEAGGLVRAPILPSPHFDQIQMVGEFLVEVVHQYADKIPFPFKDHYELWLLDKDSYVPLALLDSVCAAGDVYYPTSLNWTAGTRCHSHFKSACHNEAESKLTAAEMLNRIVNQRAGTRPAAQWFYRNKNHYGEALISINLDERYSQRELSPRLFPRMLLEQEWVDAKHRALVHDFIEWLSPWLLLLDFLKDDQREQLERHAKKQALHVDRVHHLYPRVINKKMINAARVEAMLRKASAIKENDDPQFINRH
jgi:hypothetical protein